MAGNVVSDSLFRRRQHKSSRNPCCKFSNRVSSPRAPEGIIELECDWGLRTKCIIILASCLVRPILSLDQNSWWCSRRRITRAHAIQGHQITTQEYLDVLGQRRGYMYQTLTYEVCGVAFHLVLPSTYSVLRSTLEGLGHSRLFYDNTQYTVRSSSSI